VAVYKILGLVLSGGRGGMLLQHGSLGVANFEPTDPLPGILETSPTPGSTRSRQSRPEMVARSDGSMSIDFRP